MKRRGTLIAICIAVAVAIGTTLATVMSGEGEKACRNGRLTAYILASPIDGGAAVRSDGANLPLSAGYKGHKEIAEAARSSDFKFFQVPLRIKSACRATMQNGKRFLEVQGIEEVTPVSDIGTFDRIYADFGIAPVKLQ